MVLCDFWAVLILILREKKENRSPSGEGRSLFVFSFSRFVEVCLKSQEGEEYLITNTMQSQYQSQNNLYQAY